MSLRTKQIIIALLGVTFLVSLVFVQWMEVARKQEEAGITTHIPFSKAEMNRCVNCHQQQTPGIHAHWQDSTHAGKSVGCYDCHKAEDDDADAFNHQGYTIATVVTPRDCSRCHEKEYNEFSASHHAAAGNILDSLDNFLAETVEGSRQPFDPHGTTPGRKVGLINGMASAETGCLQCHGSKMACRAPTVRSRSTTWTPIPKPASQETRRSWPKSSGTSRRTTSRSTNPAPDPTRASGG